MPIPTCQLCGRELKDPLSIAKGVGPECERKRQNLLCAAGSSEAELTELEAANSPAINRWLNFAKAALRYCNTRDARRFIAQARAIQREPQLYREVA